ncbi:MAG: adenylosuccinate synthetase [Candidatus Paceibacterota bacterium]
MKKYFTPVPGMVDGVIGLEDGDEGKGKNIDALAPHYDIVARWQGGPNAGHTIIIGKEKHILRITPSGACHPNCLLFLGNKVLINPIVLKGEAQLLKQKGIDILGKNNIHTKGRLFVSEIARLILPTHIAMDKMSEERRGKDKIGSTLNGITPAAVSDLGREGIRVGDLLKRGVKEKIMETMRTHIELMQLQKYDISEEAMSDEIRIWFEALDVITPEMIVSKYWINDQLKKGKTVLAEGAQAWGLDIDYTDAYPNATSSNTGSGSIYVGLGIPPGSIRRVYGVIKAYATKVGSGPLPTELNGIIAEDLCKKGNEYGSVTGRQRRVGWLELPKLKQAIEINGVTHVFMNKIDVLNKMPFCVATTIKEESAGKSREEFTFDSFNYESFENTEISVTNPDSEEETVVTSINDEALAFLRFIDEWLQKNTKAHLSMVGVGPDRKHFILSRQT